MVDINVGNIVTIAIISIAAVALANAGFKAAGINTNWLG
jgi:hypothetical protein